MISEPDVIVKKLILSIKGELELQNQQNVLVLPHQCLHAQVVKTSTKPIGTQTIDYHRNNLLSMQNTSVTPTLIDHQIHSLIPKYKKQTQVLIVDSSPTSPDKTADVFKKYHIIRGYHYELPSAILNKDMQQLSKQTQVLISNEHIKKDIQYVFAVISEQQPGFIGQVDLPYHYHMISSASTFYNLAFANMIKSYSQFSIQTQCPIYINLLPFGSDGYFIPFSNTGSQPTIPLPTLLQFLFKESIIDQNCYKNIVLINPNFRIHTQIDNKTIKYVNQNQNVINKMYKLGFTICFDLARYKNQQCLTWIAQYIKQFPTQTIVGPGLKYKTDFLQFGGPGLTIQQSLLHIQRILQKQYNKLMNIVSRENTIRILSWYQKKIIKVQVKMWKCLQCGKESPETQQAFKKFGKSFCSIDCVRSYKF